jgi:hypothetical protein
MDASVCTVKLYKTPGVYSTMSHTSNSNISLQTDCSEREAWSSNLPDVGRSLKVQAIRPTEDLWSWNLALPSVVGFQRMFPKLVPARFSNCSLHLV